MSETHYDIIVAPVITEKSTFAAENTPGHRCRVLR